VANISWPGTCITRTISDIDFKALIADKSFDNDAIRAELDERGALAVIPSQARRKPFIPHDTEMYKWRHLIEKLLSAPQRVPPDRHPLR
jgi:hypothetical protein